MLAYAQFDIASQPMIRKRPILVTGAHRSGSTWLGRMLAAGLGVVYIHEPFSVTDPPSPGICNAKFRYWFTHVTASNETTFRRDIENTIKLKYNWAAALKRCRSLEDLRSVYKESQTFRRHRRAGSRVLIKDPIAIFSAEWLADRFGMEPVILIRHPAAFVSSVKNLNWTHPFAHFLEQRSLMTTVLAPFASEIKEYALESRDILDQAILLWTVIHHTIAEYRDRHKDWSFVRHEDVSRDPLHVFATLYERLQLNFSPAVRAKILEYTADTNPSDPDAPVGSEATLKRDSASNVWNWKRRLTKSEIGKIREKVNDVAKSFYSDTDW